MTSARASSRIKIYVKPSGQASEEVTIPLCQQWMPTCQKCQHKIHLMLTGLALAGGPRLILSNLKSLGGRRRHYYVHHILFLSDSNRQNDLQVVSEPEVLFVCRNLHGDNSSTLTVNLMNSGTTTTGTSCRKKSA
jgi:hypothetical protein